jgi:hypothetical protein
MKAANPTVAFASLWIGGAFFFVLSATMLPTVGWVFAAPALSLAIGAAAAWWVRSTPGASTSQATVSGAIGGLGALAASVTAFAVYGWLFVNAPLGGSAGAFVGLTAGLINLALATIGGLCVGLSLPHEHSHLPAHPVPR